QTRKRAAVHVLRGDVFERLPARDEIHAIANLRIPRNRAEVFVVKPVRERAYRLRCKQRVGIERDDDLAARVTQAGVERRRLARIRNREQAHARFACEFLSDDFARRVLRAVVYDDDLVSGIIRSKQAANRVLDYELFVIGGYDDRNERRVIAARVSALASIGSEPLSDRE